MGFFDDMLDDNVRNGERWNKMKQPAQQDWVSELPIMQQSVLFAAIRNADGVAKKHKSKGLLRWYRRCILLSAFDGKALTNPNEPGGGSFTGTLSNDDNDIWTLEQAADYFIDSRDEMTLHYFAHAMHAFEIVGYHHPDKEIAFFWSSLYVRMAHALHLYPELPDALNERLGDNEAGWKARNDPSTTCSD